LKAAKLGRRRPQEPGCSSLKYQQESATCELRRYGTAYLAVDFHTRDSMVQINLKALRVAKCSGGSCKLNSESTPST
jgi:hypothetical protein